MFTRLRYSVTFPPTRQHPAGRTFSREHHFHSGFGAIVGPNEAGKSLILEFCRFVLFGTKALRGVSGDYGNLSVEADVLDMKIERTISTARLSVGGELVAKGTTPVNNRIRERLGFGLAVFDVANSINQGEIEALQDMRPAERAKLVGGVVGLDKLDDLMVYANEQALGAERAAKTVEATLIAPTQPAEPEGWPNKHILQDFLTGAERDQLELAKVNGQLDAPRVAKPEEPGAIPTPLTVEQLTGEVAKLARVRSLQMELQHLPALVDIDEANAEIEAYEAYDIAQTFLRQNPAPRFTLEEAEQALKAWDLQDRFDARRVMLDDQKRLLEKIEAAEQVVCPECDHEFHLEADQVLNMQTRIDEIALALPDYDDVPDDVPVPTMLAAEARDLLARREEIEALLMARVHADEVPVAAPPKIKRHELDSYRVAARRRPEIETELATLTPLAGAEELLDARRDWEARVATYHQQKAAWEEDLGRVAGLEKKRDELAYAPGRVAELRPIVAAFAPYEQALARYEEDMTLYELRLAQIGEMRKLAENWRAAKEALGVLRGLVKQHLYPSLAKAASILIAGMTAGARRLIEIDDEFNVMVDGQRLDTLSGSGKAVANLAIRLGLGQVLTHQVFPVIFADEIDASMDEDRAASTQDILHQCARRVSQLILVSHKKPEADWFIDLGEQSEQPPA